MIDRRAGDAGGRRSLAGQWRFRLDPDDVGVDEEWFAADPDDAVTLPGTTDENGVGEPNPAREPDRLTRTHPYEGAAWYRRTVTIPEAWADRRVALTLERTRSTRVWIDEVEVGGRDSLSTPQTYDLSDALARADAPVRGEHAITIRVDNDSEALSLPGVRRSHAATEHTQTNWNGVVGEVAIEATDPVWIDGVRVRPDPEAGTATAEVTVGNLTADAAAGRIELSARSRNAPEERRHDPVAADFEVGAGSPDAPAEAVAEIEYDLGDDPLRWDEFSPGYYRLTVSLDGEAGDRTVGDEAAVDFGMGTFEIEDARFAANGRTVFLRGNVDCCIFPETGYPPTTRDDWREFLGTAAEYGINHYRFHSWCPPEAAFEAADELGIYLQPELPIWNAETAFEDEGAVDFYRAEAERILNAYGNHPSFVMFSLGNELAGSQEAMSALVERLRGADPRRLYSCGSYNFLSDSEVVGADEYWTTASVPSDPTDAESGGRLMVRAAGLDEEPPSTTRDYAEAIEDAPIPVVAHEIGQYQTYPDFEEIEKYDGVLRARNLELARDHLEAHGMLDRAAEFRRASGQLAVRCYREDVEAALRTPGFGGFQLLDLQDFPGQGTALVGVLDSFMDSKGLIDPEEWRAFCAPVVPLVRLESRTWTADGPLEARAQVANYGPAALDGATPRWRLVDGDGGIVDSGTLPAADAPQGAVADLGSIRADLGSVDAPAKLSLELSVGGADGGPRSGGSAGEGSTGGDSADDAATNAYDVWVYPAGLPPVPAADAGDAETSDADDAGALDSAADGVRLRRSFDEGTRDLLDSGEAVLLVPRHDELRHSVEGTFRPDFWSYAMFKRRAPPGTMGPTLDPDHPLFESFPTDAHGDWQWWHLLEHSRPVVLDDAPRGYRPTVGMVDNVERNQKLGLVFETAVGEGRLLVCAVDIFACGDDPSVRQFVRALTEYAASDAFDPDPDLPEATLAKLLSI